MNAIPLSAEIANESAPGACKRQHEQQASEPVAISQRLERLQPSRALWRLVVLLSLGGFFEYYELFSTAFVVPGIIKSGILTTATTGFFGMTGVAAYIASTFAGLFVGTSFFGIAADRWGRRAVFTWALLAYSASALMMVLQNNANGLNAWRLITGVGLGVELVTIDAYLSELVPASMRGRAFALNQVITYCAVPTCALAAWALVPRSPLGIEGWRWVVGMGAAGAVVVWALRRGLPESPRWLVARGELKRAHAIVRALELRAPNAEAGSMPVSHAASTQAHAPAIALVVPRGKKDAGFKALWKGKYARRTAMLLLFHLAQTIGLYGFSNWVPTFLMKQGVTMSNSLAYTFAIAAINPLGPLLALAYADRFERKWQIVLAALLVSAAGLAFAEVRAPWLVILCGSLVTIGATTVSLNFHAYQSELFPTRIRAMAVGFVYSGSRVSGVFSGFIIAWMLGRHGVSGALAVIATCMGIVALSVGVLGPRTRGLSLEQIND